MGQLLSWRQHSKKEAIRGERTANEIGQLYGMHPNLVEQWRRQAIEHFPEILANQ